jgi:hypothetical protein
MRASDEAGKADCLRVVLGQVPGIVRCRAPLRGRTPPPETGCSQIPCAQVWVLAREWSAGSGFTVRWRTRLPAQTEAPRHELEREPAPATARPDRSGACPEESDGSRKPRPRTRPVEAAERPRSTPVITQQVDERPRRTRWTRRPSSSATERTPRASTTGRCRLRLPPARWPKPHGRVRYLPREQNSHANLSASQPQAPAVAGWPLRSGGHLAADKHPTERLRVKGGPQAHAEGTRSAAERP